MSQYLERVKKLKPTVRLAKLLKIEMTTETTMPDGQHRDLQYVAAFLHETTECIPTKLGINNPTVLFVDRV
jgi:hypothetical protein